MCVCRIGSWKVNWMTREGEKLRAMRERDRRSIRDHLNSESWRAVRVPSKAVPSVVKMSSSSLIGAVKRRRPLWDPTDVQHNNRTMVGKLWEEVATELNIDLMLAKTKWRGLRDYYRQQLRRGADSTETLSPKWVHFDEISFLEGTMAPKGHRTVKEESPEFDVSEAMEQNWTTQDEEATPFKKYTDSEMSAETDDDDLLFFKSLLPDVKNLPRARKVYIRLRIQQLIFDEIYGGRTQVKDQSQY